VSDSVVGAAAESATFSISLLNRNDWPRESRLADTHFIESNLKDPASAVQSGSGPAPSRPTVVVHMARPRARRAGFILRTSHASARRPRWRSPATRPPGPARRLGDLLLHLRLLERRMHRAATWPRPRVGRLNGRRIGRVRGSRRCTRLGRGGRVGKRAGAGPLGDAGQQRMQTHEKSTISDAPAPRGARARKPPQCLYAGVKGSTGSCVVVVM